MHRTGEEEYLTIGCYIILKTKIIKKKAPDGKTQPIIAPKKHYGLNSLNTNSKHNYT